MIYQYIHITTFTFACETADHSHTFTLLSSDPLAKMENKEANFSCTELTGFLSLLNQYGEESYMRSMVLLLSGLTGGDVNEDISYSPNNTLDAMQHQFKHICM